MKASGRLLQQCHITLFTRANCSLCTDAKKVLSNVWDRRPFSFKEIDVMLPTHKEWKIYEFDTPVIHVDSNETTATSARKLMHRFKEEQVEKLMDEVEMSQKKG